ncbi:hypothetical protein [Streptomyces sp. AP-93]|uniref:hypothetical protein n=1 Tax=Streptomyces sp. AP-93 TaxID=2929048 RepID=UPI001FB03193|nr:hypothetical protein [Streptomyces sp. AP-93]MCJ0868078.1 hypothetical protein [Streptomyces sp. AP-93]
MPTTLYPRRPIGIAIPTAPAVAMLDGCGRWTLLTRCPLCNCQHMHPAGTGDEPKYGLRRPLCRTGIVYWAMPM